MEPVNDTADTSRCKDSGLPTLDPEPCTKLKTPFGSPASFIISVNAEAVNGVIELGFATIVFPITNAGAVFHDSKYIGKFQGVINATTPKGFLKV